MEFEHGYWRWALVKVFPLKHDFCILYLECLISEVCIYTLVVLDHFFVLFFQSIDSNFHVGAVQKCLPQSTLKTIVEKHTHTHCFPSTKKRGRQTRDSQS